MAATVALSEFFCLSSALFRWCGVSEITIHSLRSNWPGARREGGSVSAAILDRLSNEAPGQFQRNPEGGLSFGRRRCCSLLTDPLRDRLWCPCGSTSRLASAQNPVPRMYSYFGDTTLARRNLSRIDAVADGERGRLDRCRRRPADAPAAIAFGH